VKKDEEQIIASHSETSTIYINDKIFIWFKRRYITIISLDLRRQGWLESINNPKSTKNKSRTWSWTRSGKTAEATSMKQQQPDEEEEQQQWIMYTVNH